MSSNPSELPYASLVARGMASLRVKTAAQERLFPIDTAAWALDQHTGQITFTSDDGMVATAPAQIIGSYDTMDGIWLWSWANPSVQPLLSADARLARDYGRGHGVSELTTAELAVPEAKCWELAAAACELAGGQGVYGGLSGGTRVFVAYGALRVSKPH